MASETSAFDLGGRVGAQWGGCSSRNRELVERSRMTVTTRSLDAVPSLLGGSISLPANPCTHPPARHASPWAGEAGTAGRVAVVGAGKMGLPLAAQFRMLIRVQRS